MTAKPTNCVWANATCSYLGHVVGWERVQPELCKVSAVQDFRRTVTKSDVRSYLGLTGYYRWFVPQYVEHTAIFTTVTRKTAPVKVKWTTALEDELQYLKHSLSHIHSLTIPTREDSFLLQTDASTVGIGAVWSVRRDNEEKPVVFYSRKLQPREQRYSATELEGLAVVDSVDHFSVYLIRTEFTIETGHKALEFLNSAKRVTGRLARWALHLQPFSYKIKYHPGSKNGNADGLSRQAWNLPEARDLPNSRDGFWPPGEVGGGGGGGGRGEVCYLTQDVINLYKHTYVLIACCIIIR